MFIYKHYLQAAGQHMRAGERRSAGLRERVPGPHAGHHVPRRHGRQTQNHFQVSFHSHVKMLGFLDDCLCIQQLDKFE